MTTQNGHAGALPIQEVPLDTAADSGRGRTVSAAWKAEVMDHIHARGDRLVLGFIGFHALLAVAFAFFYQTWLVTSVVTACALSMFALSVWLLPRSFITRCIAGVSLQMFVALHIYQLHGMPELHFLFFTAFTVLIVYQDWKSMWPGAIGLIGQHLVFAVLHNAGYKAGILFYEDDYVGFTKLAFHASIALGEVGICGYWAYLLQRQTLANAVQNAGLREMGAKLHRSEAKFRALIEHALDIITVVDRDGTVLYESPAIHRVLGYTPEELLGRNTFEFIHPDDQAHTLAAFARRRDSSEDGTVPTEFRYRHRDGSWRVLEAVGSAWDESVGGLVINSRDVTGRQRAEQEARRRASQQVATSGLARQALAGKESLAELLDAAVGLVARTLAVEHCYVAEHVGEGLDLRIRGAFGYSTNDVQLQTVPSGTSSQGGYTLLVNEPVVVDDMPMETRFLASDFCRQEGVRSGLSVVIQGRGGPYGVLVCQSAEPSRFSHDDAVFLSATADILSSALERRRVQEALLAAKDEAEKANAAKSEFLSRVSHELRTPLNAILGFGQHLEMTLPEGTGTESVAYILRAGRHLLNLIDEVLAISRMEAGRMELSLEPVSVDEVVAECLALVARQAEARRVACANHCTPAALPHRFVQADRQRLRQVLLNLLSNAVKYNREGGSVRVTCREMPGASPDAAPRLRLEVTDTGHGLTAREIARLFRPFERLQAERSGTEGTGLGLALSKGFVEVMGGTIGVQSVPDEGSTFWLELPVTEDPADRLRSTLPVAGLGSPGRGTVLYIEDNLSNLRLIEMLLEERLGFELLSAQQGTLGLEMARARRPSLILLDLHLPDLPGWDVLAELQADPATRDIPVVVVSADATRGQIARLLAAGAQAYLTKPIDVARLMEVLRKYLEVEPAPETVPA